MVTIYIYIYEQWDLNLQHFVVHSIILEGLSMPLEDDST